MKGSKIMALFYLIILHQLFNGLFLFHFDDYNEWRKTSSVLLSTICVILTSYMTIGLFGALRANSVKVVSHNTITYVNGVGSSANYISCMLTIGLYIFATMISVYVSWDSKCTNQPGDWYLCWICSSILDLCILDFIPLLIAKQKIKVMKDNEELRLQAKLQEHVCYSDDEDFSDMFDLEEEEEEIAMTKKDTKKLRKKEKQLTKA